MKCESMKPIETIFLILSIFFGTVIAVDTISGNQTIRDGNSTIESVGGIFELGFFGSGNSSNRFLGIWYKKISNKTVVWVANRETPLVDTSGVLRFDGKGSLVLMDGNNGTIWSSNSSGSAMNPVAQLLDNGNLVIRHGNGSDPENYLWQSFDHPADNLLPGMKLGWDLGNGLERYLTSWRSVDDPSPGSYSFRVNLDGYPQVLVWRRSSVVQVRFGPWDGIQFSGVNLNIPELSFKVSFVFDPAEIYSSFAVDNSSVTVMRMTLTTDGVIQVLRWIDQTQSWRVYLSEPLDVCGSYAVCGAYGVCNITQYNLGHGECGCLEGYKPKIHDKWKSGDWTDGCVRKAEFECGNGDKFVKYSGLKLPDARSSWYNDSMGIQECQSVCLKNCSCTAYSSITIIQGGTGCLLWFDELIDTRDYSAKGLDLFVRVSASELAGRSSRTKRLVRDIAIVVSILLTILLAIFVSYVLKKRKLRRKTAISTIHSEKDAKYESEREELELPLFDLMIIVNATDKFSQVNKLGEGGFGPVYKGILEDGQEIAVKRLSKDSRQGLGEFKNEIACIAKLQHRNLVKLLGCCIEEGEVLLIYEYMPNKSLDSFLFDKKLSKSLKWSERDNIINGIARGILYLHQDSRLRIIHRDLKASNILLDKEMNPRISDFGMARSFGESGRMANTTKVVGTFGYMSPEYALDGIFSIKSDVYSFGVLVIEIVSGKKMKGFYDPDPNNNLLGHAWRLYKEGKVLELISGEIMESCNPSEIFRVTKIGLLCVQPHPEDRPSMSLVVLMLSSEIELPEPKQPGFFTERTPVESNSSPKILQKIFLSNKFSSANSSPR